MSVADSLFESLQCFQSMIDSFGESLSQLHKDNNTESVLDLWKNLMEYYRDVHKDLQSSYDALEIKEENPEEPGTRGENEENKTSKVTGSSLASSSVGKVLSSVKVRPEIKILCDKADGEGLRNYIAGHIREIRTLRNELRAAISKAPDAAKLVMKALEGYDLSGIGLVGTGDKWACILLLESLFPVFGNDDSGVVPSDIKDSAREIAKVWRKNLKVSKKEGWNIHAFLQLLASFRIAADYKKDELLALVSVILTRDETPELCRCLGLSSEATNLMSKLPEGNRQLKALKFAHVCGFMDKVDPVGLLTSYLRCEDKDAEQLLTKGRGSAYSQFESISKKLYALKNAIKHVQDYGLQNHFLEDYWEKKLRELEKERDELKKPIQKISEEKSAAEEEAQEKEDRKEAAEKKAQEKKDGKKAVEKETQEKKDGKKAAEKKANEKEDGKKAAEKKAQQKEDGKKSAEKKVHEKEDGKKADEKKAQEKEDGKKAAEKKAQEKEDGQKVAEKKAQEKEDGKKNLEKKIDELNKTIKNNKEQLVDKKEAQNKEGKKKAAEKEAQEKEDGKKAAQEAQEKERKKVAEEKAQGKEDGKKAAEKKAHEKEDGKKAVEKPGQHKRRQSFEPGYGSSERENYASKRANYASLSTTTRVAGGMGNSKASPYNIDMVQDKSGIIGHDGHMLAFSAASRSSTGFAAGAFSSGPFTAAQINDERRHNPSAFGTSNLTPIGSSLYGFSAPAGAFAVPMSNFGEINYEGRGQQNYLMNFGKDKNNVRASVYGTGDLATSSATQSNYNYEGRVQQSYKLNFGAVDNNPVSASTYGIGVLENSSATQSHCERRGRELYRSAFGDGNTSSIGSSVYGSNSRTIPFSDVNQGGHERSLGQYSDFAGRNMVSIESSGYGPGVSTAPPSNVTQGHFESRGSVIDRYQFNSGLTSLPPAY